MNEFLDVRGLPCPQPVLAAKKIIKKMNARDVLTVLCADEITLVDFKAFCHTAQHELRGVILRDHVYELSIVV